MAKFLNVVFLFGLGFMVGVIVAPCYDTVEPTDKVSNLQSSPVV